MIGISIQTALALHRAGHVSQAEAAYAALLAVNPSDPMATHYLGLAAHQNGNRSRALALIRRSVELSPRVADFHCNLGVVLRDMGELEQAAAALCEAVKLRPRYPEALSNLGDVLRMQGRAADAEAVLRQAVNLKPSPEAANNLGLALLDLKKPAEALAAFRDALRARPDDASVQRNAAVALLASGEAAAAVAAFRAVLHARPDDVAARAGLGNALRAAGDWTAAAAAYRIALHHHPDDPDLLGNLSATLTDLGDAEHAIPLGRKSLAHKSASDAHRYNLSLALLMTGRYEEGWRFYESRWACDGFVGTLPPLDEPEWDGSDPAGKIILLRAEQGCGDAVQFARYVPLLAARGATVVLQCQPELTSLLSTLPGVSRVVAHGEFTGPFDVHLPLLSLPHRFGTNLETVPAAVPYLHANPARLYAWRERLAGLSGMKVGVVWAGNPAHRNDRNRSVPLNLLAPLAAVPGVSLVSIQKGPAAAQAANSPVPLLDVSNDLGDFADTAACLAHLDLLVTVDTSVAHVAGALGRPVWTLLAHAPDCALDDPLRNHPLVPHDASVPPTHPQRLARGHRPRTVRVVGKRPTRRRINPESVLVQFEACAASPVQAIKMSARARRPCHDRRYNYPKSRITHHHAATPHKTTRRYPLAPRHISGRSCLHMALMTPV